MPGFQNKKAYCFGAKKKKSEKKKCSERRVRTTRWKVHNLSRTPVPSSATSRYTTALVIKVCKVSLINFGKSTESKNSTKNIGFYN